MRKNVKGNIAKVLAVASLITTIVPAATFAASTPVEGSTGGSSLKPAVEEAAVETHFDKANFDFNLYKDGNKIFPELEKGKVKEDTFKDLEVKITEVTEHETITKDVFKIGGATTFAEKDGVMTFTGKAPFVLGDKKYDMVLEVKPGTDKVEFRLLGYELEDKEGTDVRNGKGIATVVVTKEYKVEKPASTPATATEKAAANEFVNNIKVKAVQGKIIAEIPQIATGLKGTVVFKNTVDKTAKDITVTDVKKAQTVELGNIAVNNGYVADVVIYRDATDDVVVLKADKSYSVDLSKVAPVVNYAYVIDGALVINSTSAAGMAKTPLFWKYSYEKDFRAIAPDLGYGYSYKADSITNEDKANFDNLFGKTTYDRYQRLDANDYRIPLEIPCKVQIVFVDALGNKTPVSLTINEDNVILKGTGIGEAPAYVGKLIKSVTDGGTFESAREKDLLVIKKDTTVNLYETFKSLIQKEWDSYNSRELNWKCDEFSDFDTYRLKFNKEGRYEFEVTKDGSKGKVTFTVLVMDGKNNIKDFKVLKDVKVNGDKFEAIKGLEFKTTDGKDANPVGFYAKYDGKYYRLTDKIPFATEKNKDATEALVTIKDVQNNRNYEVKFIKTAATKVPLETARNMFSDIKGHWSENRVVTLVANGVIAGYPDGTFKPDNMISSRETLAIVGRFAQSLDKEKVNAVVNDKVEFTKSNWGNDDVEWVLKRLPQNVFAGQDLDKQITREQTAYVLNHVFKYNTVAAATTLSDVNTSKYQTEINQLVAAGTIKGYPDGTFKPTVSLTRAELCSMMFVIPGVQYQVIAQDTAKTPANKTTGTATNNTAKDTKIDTSKLEDLFK